MLFVFAGEVRGERPQHWVHAVCFSWGSVWWETLKLNACCLFQLGKCMVRDLNTEYMLFVSAGEVCVRNLNTEYLMFVSAGEVCGERPQHWVHAVCFSWGSAWRETSTLSTCCLFQLGKCVVRDLNTEYMLFVSAGENIGCFGNQLQTISTDGFHSRWGTPKYPDECLGTTPDSLCVPVSVCLCTCLFSANLCFYFCVCHCFCLSLFLLAQLVHMYH